MKEKDSCNMDSGGSKFCADDAVSGNKCVVEDDSACQQQIHKGTTSKALPVSSSIGVVGILIGYSLSWLFSQVHKKKCFENTFNVCFGACYY